MRRVEAAGPFKTATVVLHNQSPNGQI